MLTFWAVMLRAYSPFTTWHPDFYGTNKRKLRQLKKFKLAILALLVASLAMVVPAMAAPTPSVVYDATPNPLPGNVASLGFQATQTSEFGDYIHLGGTDRVLQTVVVTMSDWALYSDYALDVRYMNDSASWTHPITVNVYANTLTGGVPDTLLASVTKNVTIPWRPVADPSCGSAWKDSGGNCFNGLAFNASFDFSSLGVTVPNDIIIGVAYNTQTYGAEPMGVNGPYNSLNVGIAENQIPTVGSDDNADNVFWNTSTAAWYTDGGAAGVGVFRQDTNWAPYGTVNLKVTASAPLVGPPTNKDQCKKNGWKVFNNPSFKNQGECVSSVVAKTK